MSRWIVSVEYKDGGSSLHVYNHQNTAIREADRLRQASSRRVSIYEEARPCTDQGIKNNARALTETLKADQNSACTSLHGLYAWWPLPSVASLLCEEVGT